MSCLINQELRDALLAMVASELAEKAKAGEALDIEKYITDVFLFAKEQSGGNIDLAADAAMLTPTFVDQVLALQPKITEVFKAKNKNIRIDVLMKVQEFEDINTVRDFLGLNKPVAEIIEAAEEFIETPVIEEPAAPSEEQQQIEMLEWWNTLPLGAFVTYGSERKPDGSVDEANKINAEAIREITEALSKSALSDSSQLEKPVFLKIMRAGKANVDVLGRTAYGADKGMIAVLVDQSGDPVEKIIGGKTQKVYFKLYSPVAFKADGKTLNLNKQEFIKAVKTASELATVRDITIAKIDPKTGKRTVVKTADQVRTEMAESLYKKVKTSYDNLTRQNLEKGMSQDEAEATALKELSQEFEMFENMRKYVEDQNKDVKAVITGSTKGFVIVDQYNPTPLKQIFGEENFQPVSVKKEEIGLDLTEGTAYFNYPGINKPITIAYPSLASMPELMETIISLFTDVLVDENGNPISAQKRNTLIQQFLLKKYSKIGFAPTKGEGLVYPDGSVRIAIGDKFESITYDEKGTEKRKQVANMLREAFSKPYESDKQLPLTAKNIDDYKINVVKTLSGPVKPNTVQERNGKYYKVHMPFVSVVGEYVNKVFEKPTIENGVLKIEKQAYNKFVRDNFGANVQVGPNNKIEAYNPTVTYAPTIEDVAKFSASPEVEKQIEKSQEPVVEKPQSDAPATQTGLSFDDIGAGLAIEKNLFQKMQNEKAREEHIKAAKDWYDKSPIFKDPVTGQVRFSFEIVYKAMNQTRGPVAQWAIDGIRLFHYYSENGTVDPTKSGDFTDLYHEAWHAFTQTFLTPAQRKSMYAEARKRSGSFMDYNGNHVTFANADVWQLEEFLAEEFREYMISGGKKTIKGSPATRSIFKQILDFLKSLFGGANSADVIKNPMSYGPIFEMYENLRIGNLSSYNFSIDNRDKTIGVLNSLQARDNNTEKKISIQDAKMLVGSIDSVISQFATAVTEARGGDRTYITQLMSTTEGKKAVYKKALETLINRKNLLQEEYDKLSPEDPISSYRRHELRQLIELLDWATGPNFGDIETLSNNKDNKGLIAFHAEHSKYLSEEDKESLFDDEELDEAKQNEEARGQGFDRSGNEVSQYDLASPEIKYLLRSILKYDEKGMPVKNIIGIQELADTHVVWNKIARTLNGVMNMEQMWRELDKAAHERDAAGNIVKTIDPTISNLLRKLGDVNLQSDANASLWIKFEGTFNMVSIPLMQMTVEEKLGEVIGFDRDKPVRAASTYKMTIGQANSSSRRTFNLWKNAFQTLPTKYLIRDLVESTPDGKLNPKFNMNYLDVDAVLKDFSDEKGNLKDAPNFLRAIGVRLSEKESINNAVNANEGSPKMIFKRLKTLSSKDVKRIYSLNDVFKEYEEYGLASDMANLTALGNLENRYSDHTSNYAQTNAEGNTQYELSLHNSMSIMVSTINAASSYQALMEVPHMRHLNIDTNPFAASSLWLNSIFELYDESGNRITDSRFGRRREDNGVPAKLNMSNLSGVQMVNENGSDGIASANADEFTKMIMDFHLTLNGRPELMRHADKGTSFSLWIQKIVGGGKKGAYVDTLEFFEDDLGNIEGYDKTAEIMMNYLNAEMQRISKLKAIQEQAANQTDKDKMVYDAFYIEKGQKFVIFEDILTEDMQAKLIAAGDLNNIDKKLRADVLKEIKEYINDQYEKVKEAFEDNAFIDATLAHSLHTQAKLKGAVAGPNASSQNAVRKDGKKTLTKTENAMVRSFVVNNWIHNIESMNIIYGDIAQYNMAKEEFHKRNAGAGSTGNLLSTSKAAINYANSKGRKYAASLKNPNIKEKQLSEDGSIQTAILADNEIPSAYFDQIREAIAERITEKNKGLSKEELEEKIFEATKAYGLDEKGKGQMTEGDAQGWITFDFYRQASILEGKWTTTQEKLYNDIVAGKAISKADAIEFFPTKKYQYWGPVEYRKNVDGQFAKDDSGYLPTMAFHKFSLFPLIPNVIEGTNLEKLHTKMMTQGIDYAVFKSGSKISTLTRLNKNGGKIQDEFYNKKKGEREFDSDSEFTPNTVYMQFLKNQLEIAPYFKEEVTFPTQMRKLIENGLMEGGVPTDFGKEFKTLAERQAAWNALKTEKEKIEASDYYAKVVQYEKDVKDLTDLKRENLIKEANIKFRVVNGERVAQVDKKFIEFIQGELTRQELGDHEIEFLKAGKGGVGIAHDLSYSLSSEKLEKILNAIVVKRLVKQKFKGEGLIQVSGAGWETNLRGELTDEEKLKYGTNELPFYSRNYYVDENGVKRYTETKAMKVKIAMQGDFYNLLELKHKDGEKIGDIKRLNEMLKDEEWLDIGDHRDMISITGPRIPTQENNSMEFAEVYEFLPEQAGNIVVLPSEIVAKSGGDFDIDKITFMFPTIKAKVDMDKLDYKMLTQFYNKTEEELREIVEKKKKDRTEEEQTIVDSIRSMYPKNVTLPMDRTSEEGLANRILKDMREILALKDNYVSLVRPNGTDLIKPLADDLADDVMKYKPKDRFRGKAGKTIAGTRIFEIQYNLYKHGSNNIGKQTLGIGAVDNTYNTVFNRIGMHMNSSYVNQQGIKKDIRILLNHNKVKNAAGEEVISLGHLYDATGATSISSVVGQLINGWVDIAKDAWIFNIQGNKEISPTLLFMVQAGIPVDQAVYLVSHPIIRKYVEEQKLAKSMFAGPLGKAGGNPLYYRSTARKAVFKELFDEKTAEVLTGKAQAREKKIDELTKQYEKDEKIQKMFNSKETSDLLKARITKKDNWEDQDRAIFLHFLELEQMAASITKLKSATNFDTTRSATLFDAQKKVIALTELKQEAMFPTEMVDKILSDSPIGSFYVQEFQLSLWKDLFKLRNNDMVNEFLLDKMSDFNSFNDAVEKTFGDREKLVNEFRNDLTSFIFQNSLHAFDINAKTYKGLNIQAKGKEVKEVTKLEHAVFVKDGVIYMDKEQLEKDYQAIELNKYKYSVTLKDGTVLSVAPVKKGDFKTAERYYAFIFERELARAQWKDKFDVLKERADVQAKIAFFEKAMAKQENETDAHFQARVNTAVFEEFIRDLAMDNTYNEAKLFGPTDSMATQLTQIQVLYPELASRYSLVNALSSSNLEQAGRVTATNIMLNDSMVDDPEKINIFHQNLLELSDPGKIKLNTTSQVEKQRVADFFNRLTIYAFLQSGMNTKGMYSLIRLVPQQKFTDLMTLYGSKFLDDMNMVTLEKYWNKFLKVNSDRKTRTRMRDYSINNYNPAEDKALQNRPILKERPAAPAIEFTTDKYGNKIFDGSSIKGISTAGQAIKENPDVVFAINGVAKRPDGTMNTNGADTKEAALFGAKLGNVVGLPVRNMFKQSEEAKMTKADILPDGQQPTEGVNGVASTGKTETGDDSKTIRPINSTVINPALKEQIDSAISTLKDYQAQGKTIAFPKAGFGQYMIGADDLTGELKDDKIVPIAPQAFVYLSQQLWENFKYVNPNFDKALGFTSKPNVLQANAEVTDQEVLDALSFCFKL